MIPLTEKVSLKIIETDDGMQWVHLTDLILALDDPELELDKLLKGLKKIDSLNSVQLLDDGDTPPLLQ